MRQTLATLRPGAKARVSLDGARLAGSRGLEVAFAQVIAHTNDHLRFEPRRISNNANDYRKAGVIASDSQLLCRH
jgi:hypothetical protein